MNLCHFMGNLTRDPEIKTLPKGNKVCSFGLALNESYKDKDTGEKKNAVTFIDCEAWDKTAELIEKFFVKGALGIFHCSVKQDSWTDKDSGAKRTKHKFRVNGFNFVPGSSKGKGEKGSDAATEDPMEAPDGDTEIPF